MKKINIVVLVFGSALLLFVYQNCQKAAFTQKEESNSVLSLPDLDYNYKSLEMSGSGGFRACEGRCLTSGKILIDLENGKLSVKGYWMGGSDLSVATVTEMPADNPNLTDFTLNLDRAELQEYQSSVNNLKLVEHVIPACDPCFIVMDMPHVLHKLKDYNDIEKSIYLFDFIDPNINNATVHAYASENELNGLICKIIQKVDGNSISKSLRSDTLEIIKMSTHINLNSLSCE